MIKENVENMIALVKSKEIGHFLRRSNTANKLLGGYNSDPL